MAKRQTEEQVFRERLAECPYLYGVQRHWSREFTELRMTTLDEGVLLRPCDPKDLEKLEVYVYYESKGRRRSTRTTGQPPNTGIGAIWYFVGGRNLAYEISKVSWEGMVTDIVIAHRHSFFCGKSRGYKTDPSYAVIEVYRGRDISRVAELLAKTKGLIPINSAST